MWVNFNISLKEMISWENVKYKNISQEGFKPQQILTVEFGTVKKKKYNFPCTSPKGYYIQGWIISSFQGIDIPDIT